MEDSLDHIIERMETPEVVIYFSPVAMYGQWIFRNESAAWLVFSAHALSQAVWLAEPKY